MMPPDTRSAAHWAKRRRARKIRRYVIFATCAAVVIGAAVGVAVVRPWSSVSVHTQRVRYLGVYEPDAPQSYAGVDQFAQAIGRQPNLVSYYSDWGVPFQTGFATSAEDHGAVTLVQMDPKNVSLGSIVTGRYDTYLRSYAAAVRKFGRPVVLSFGHEMNGYWYSWGYHHTPAKVFVAAWRHIVTVFREVGASNVIWLWTVNVVDTAPSIPNPGPWWPGRSYVNWVGIDGYYYESSQNFSQVFGPTIVAVRALTNDDPILIAETGAAPSTGQPAKINDLFDGIRTYGLYGFVWFDENTQGKVWRLNNAGSFGAFRQDAKDFMKPPATPAPTL
jgi:mannan endo-1,4-beta-mannosidase